MPKANQDITAEILPEPTVGGRTVRAIDLARFINSALAATKIVMKLDIEGAEHNILPRLIMTGALCRVDVLFMEQHMWQLTAPQQDVLRQSTDLFPAVARAAGCKTEMSMLDDETYFDDADSTVNTC